MYLYVYQSTHKNTVCSSLRTIHCVSLMLAYWNVRDKIYLRSGNFSAHYEMLIESEIITICLPNQELRLTDPFFLFVLGFSALACDIFSSPIDAYVLF